MADFGEDLFDVFEENVDADVTDQQEVNDLRPDNLEICKVDGT